MKTLTLRIDNFATLESGLPIFLILEEKAAKVGRNMDMEWVLPDSSRHISGHHFDITFEDGEYHLTDVSTNGTYFDGERYRMSTSKMLQNGMRFTVGKYIISVTISGESLSSPAVSQPSGPPQNNQGYSGDFASNTQAQHNDVAVSIPDPFADSISVSPQMPQMAEHDISDMFGTSVQQPSIDFEKAPNAVNIHEPAGFEHSADSVGVQKPSAMPSTSVNMDTDVNNNHFAHSPQIPAPSGPHHAIPEVQTGRQQEHLQPLEQAVDASVKLDANDKFLADFLSSAGVKSVHELAITPEELAEFVAGALSRSTEQIMLMMRDRAAVKLFVLNEDRTMRVASGNNPLKFLSNPEEAFEAMFLKPRQGYMTGEESIGTALAEIRAHQAAIIAALQPALAEMLEGLSPEEIEEDVGGSLLTSSKKNWSEYTKRWEKKSAEGDNGILDAFLKAFSKHYAKAINSKTDDLIH